MNAATETRIDTWNTELPGRGVSQAALRKALRAAGWPVLDVFVNAETGRVRIVAERRDGSNGLKVTIDRGDWTGRVCQMRDLTVLRHDFNGSGWEVDLSSSCTGARVWHDDLSDAISSLADRIAEDCAAVNAATISFALEAATP